MPSNSQERYVRRNPAWYVAARALLTLLLALVLVGYGAYRVGNMAYQRVLTPISATNNAPVAVHIPSGTSLTGIATILEDNELIRNRTIFKLVINFFDNAGKLKAGDYTLNRTMSMDDIMDELTRGMPPREEVQFTLREGLTVEQVADVLVNTGLLAERSRFVTICTTGEEFESYSFVQEAIRLKQINASRKYAMEGYLAPDTYKVFADATEEDILRKLLNQYQVMYVFDYDLRATDMNMTNDQVMILASLIEKEAGTADFKKVSAVFHARLQQGIPLASDATVSYVTNVVKLNMTDQDIAIESPYNTYKYKGLPPGPICNPGAKAIEAALYPDEEFMAAGYLYFCTADPANGTLVFAKTLEEHNDNVNIYRPLWIEADKAKDAGQ